MAFFAVQVVALLLPVIVFGVTSPNITPSRSVFTICSSWIVRLFVWYWVSTLFTRQMIPFPGSWSSRSHAPTWIAGASGPTVIVAVLFRSSRFSAMLSGRNQSAVARLCPLSKYIPPSLPVFRLQSLDPFPEGFRLLCPLSLPHGVFPADLP